MTLTEAIEHCKERAAADCSECADQHRQLAEWLTELKRYKIAGLAPKDLNNLDRIISICYGVKYAPDVMQGGYTIREKQMYNAACDRIVDEIQLLFDENDIKDIPEPVYNSKPKEELATEEFKKNLETLIGKALQRL